MTILDRYFGKKLVAALFKTILALVTLFIMIDLLTHRRAAIVRHEVPWPVVLTYYVFYIPQVLYRYQVAALAMLVSALLVLGNAAQNNELTAALAGGASLRRLMRGPVLVAAALAFGMFVLQDTVAVSANRRAIEIESRYFEKSAESKRPGISWANLPEGWTCHIMKFNRTALTGEGVLMHCIAADRVQQIEADRVYWDPARRQWMLENGRWLVFDPKLEWQEEAFRITQWPAPILDAPEVLFALEEPADVKSAANLKADILRAEQYGMPVGFHWAEFYAKFSQPALCFVMIWLAIPFAMRLRRGGLAVGLGMSVAIGLVYLILFRVSMGLGHADKLSPIVAAWLANAAFLALGLFLTWRTET